MLGKNSPFLRIGKISYANLFPIYYYLERECDYSKYKFIDGVPSSLNKMLRGGKIDVSPSSSIEYLRHKEKYSIIPWLSISSAGPVCSIFLFSRFPLESLNKKNIAVSSQSETSVVLLKIILRDFYSLKCKFVTVNSNSIKRLLSDFSACLLIGDAAMREAKKAVASCKLQVASENRDRTSRITHHVSPYIYDLGELWFKHTGLPFVFALWMVRKETLSGKKELIRKFSSDLINAKKYAYKKFTLIARYAPQKKWLGEKELVSYWKGISYDFTDKHMEGLRLFEKYAAKY